MAQDIRDAGGEAFALQADVADSRSLGEAADRALQKRGTVAILVNCAGTNHFSMPTEYTAEQWERLLAVNLAGQWHCCQAVMPEMMKKRGGKILNIGSAAAILAIPKAAPYIIAKHGVVGLTRALAVDLGPYNINVNCICPATVVTPLLKEATNQAFVEGMIKNIPMGRLGGIFLCSRAVIPSMVSRKRGVIVCLSSISAKEGNANMAPYSVSKAGIL